MNFSYIVSYGGNAYGTFPSSQSAHQWAAVFLSGKDCQVIVVLPPDELNAHKQRRSVRPPPCGSEGK